MALARRLRGPLAFGLIIATVAALAFWAGSNVADPPTLPEHAAQAETYEVRDGTIGRTQRVPVTAQWQRVGTLRAGREGTLTTIELEPGTPVEPGMVVATVDLEPVVVAAGSVPMFRTLREGDTGPDVRQFQELLRTGGDLADPPDGVFGASTTAATMAWQQRIGAEPDGVVEPGSLVFVPELPVRMMVIASVGDPVGPDSDLLASLGATPTFEGTVSVGQRGDLTSGLAIAIEAPDGTTWPGTLGQFTSLDGMSYAVGITDADCGDTCESIPLTGQTVLGGQVVVVPEVHGLVVPTSAMVRLPSGEFAVTLADGTQQVLTIEAQADGFAVVEGVAPGTEIRLPSLR